jgi:hypothetical protein
VTAEFNWWLLIVGLVVGATLVWLVLADSARRDSEITNEELPIEAAWIAATMREAGEAIEPEITERVLRLHRVYLSALPPDDPDDVDDSAAFDDEVGPPASPHEWPETTSAADGASGLPPASPRAPREAAD